MPAPLAKGILISLSILAAIGIAVYENPQVKDWVEDQRRKITEFLRTFGDELDPQSRREAEAFAYEGRLPTQSRDTEGSANAIARATGRETSDDAVSRRNRISHGPQSPDEAAERRRLGREYLAKRNQEILDLRERQKMRKSVSGESEKAPSSPTFDQLVNADGTLKNEKDAEKEAEEFNEKALELPSVPTDEPKTLLRKIAVEEPPMEAAFQTGSRYANPFSDEFEFSGSLDSRSPTPKPPVPPKIALEDSNKVRRLSVPQKEPSIRQIPILDQDDEPAPTNLSYDEQLARALSLSLAESEAAARLARAKQEEQDPDYAAAVAASLAEADKQKQKQSEQLINLTAHDPPISVPDATTTQTQQHAYPDNDELYTLSPSMALRTPIAIQNPIIPPYDPVHEAAAATSTPLHSPTTATFSSPEVERDAISFSSASSATAEFASAPASVAASEMSLIDFGDVESVDSGDESEPDGVLTPGSWTDVGSDVGSEDGEGVRVS